MTTIKDSEIQIAVECIPGPDFTTYETKEALEARLPKDKRYGKDENGKIQEKHSHALSCLIKSTSDKKPVPGRGLACQAYNGNLWSITLRCEAGNERRPNAKYEREDDASHEYRKLLCSTLGAYSAENPSEKGKPQDYLGYCPRGHPEYDELFTAVNPSASNSGKEIFLNDIYVLCRELYDILLSGPASQTNGLIVITGATDSSKSLITRGLIFLFLEASAKKALAKGLRKPHLITFEDPVEQYYLKDPDSHRAPALQQLKELLDGVYIDYTPREKDTDANNLRDVIKDALRQTPAVLFVGETREKEDWKELLEFAGSGHLVITTSHASSVVEAMTRIFRDTETRTPAQRSEIARRILGIINIRNLRPQVPSTFNDSSTEQQTDPSTTSNCRALLPALWKSTSQSNNNLIADGLASLLPALGREDEIGYYSRTYFAKRLTAEYPMTTESPMTTGSPMTAEFEAHPDKTSLLKEIERQAREWDIEGV